MFKAKNIIKYAAINDSFSSLEPSKKHLPKWFTDAPLFDSGIKNNKIVSIPNPSFKMCTAFSESFNIGYMITLPVDIVVEQTEGGPSISWRPELNQTFVKIRNNDNQNISLPTPEGFSPIHFAWETKLSIEIPKDYSILLTHPFNRYDLPFFTLSGIIDGFYDLPPGNIPVFFKNNFEGIIEKGTPIAQILPFKTENWLSQTDKEILEKSQINDMFAATKIFGWYKKNIWKKKSYE